MSHTGSATAFYKSRLAYGRPVIGLGWRIRFTNGGLVPQAVGSDGPALARIVDRVGNAVVVATA
jgi:hypothetical protein